MAEKRLEKMENIKEREVEGRDINGVMSNKFGKE